MCNKCGGLKPKATYEELGYELQVDIQGYKVLYGGRVIAAALTPTKCNHFTHKRKMYQDNMSSAMRLTKEHNAGLQEQLKMDNFFNGDRNAQSTN